MDQSADPTSRDHRRGRAAVTSRLQTSYHYRLPRSILRIKKSAPDVLGADILLRQADILNPVVACMACASIPGSDTPW